MQSESSRISAAKSSTEHARANAVTACASLGLGLRLTVAQIAAVAESAARNAAKSMNHGIVAPFFNTCS